MSEPGSEVSAIERGRINDEDWRSLVLMAQNWGGHLVVADTMGANASSAEFNAEPIYASRSEFLQFAVDHDFTLPGAIKAYRGLFRIYHEQQAGIPPLGQMQALRFAPHPDYERLGQVFEQAGDYSVDVGSLRGLIADVDEALAGSSSPSERLRFQTRILPRMVGIGTLNLYRKFVDSKIDKK
jgi:hypothetical protein